MADHNTIVTGYPVANGYPTTTTAAAAAAATAYPYPPHPQHNHPPYTTNPYYPNQQQQQQQRATFLRRILAVLIAFTIITGTIIFITWLILRPQLPQFLIKTLTLTLTNLNQTSNSTISGNWNTTFTVRNPNSKLTLFYDHFQAAVFYKSESIAETSVPPFSQGKKNETTVTATFVSVSAYVSDWNGVGNERGNLGIVEFNLRMVVRVRFKAGGWRGRKRVLRVYCPDLLVRVVDGNISSSSGSLISGGYKKCRVGL